jgi:hypothetical protein
MNVVRKFSQVVGAKLRVESSLTDEAALEFADRTPGVRAIVVEMTDEADSVRSLLEAVRAHKPGIQRVLVVDMARTELVLESCKLLLDGCCCSIAYTPLEDKQLVQSLIPNAVADSIEKVAA